MLNEKINFKGLHVIRGICALIVVIYHSKFILWSGGTLYLSEKGLNGILDYFLFGIDMLSSCGAQCVMVFFILSGFVIHYSFELSNRSLYQFYTIRFIRIYIPYFVSLILAAIVLYLAVRWNKEIAIEHCREYNTRLLIAFNEINITTFWKSLLFIPANEYFGFNFAYWSLLHEAIFYLVFPIYFFCGKRIRVMIFFLLVLLSFLFNSSYLYYQIYFMLGVMLYDYYKTEKKFRVNRFFYWAIILIGFIGVNILVKLNREVFADIASAIVVIVVFDYLIKSKRRSIKALHFLSDMSYSLYLNHLTVLLVFYALYTNFTGKLIFFERGPYYLGVILSLVVCFFLYGFIERNTLKLIRAKKEKWEKLAKI